jgi:CDP-diacylglycerol--glycerol-3-phosphate 3-phosphatidyltransferase
VKSAPPSIPPGSSAKSIRRRRRRTLREDALNLPNMLTMARILAIPLVLALLDRGGPRDCYWAAWLFAGAAITDFLDGYLARKRGLVSVLGKFLDPLADKLIVMASLVWMVPMGRIAPWVVSCSWRATSPSPACARSRRARGSSLPPARAESPKPRCRWSAF